MSTSKITLIALLSIMGLFLLGVIGSAMNLITIPWLKFNRQVQMERGIVERTYNADNAIYNYHWFLSRAENIEATERKIELAIEARDYFKASAGDRSKWTFEDKNEEARLNTIVLGLKNHYEEIVAEYNARANSVDRAIFKDELPLFFSLKAY